MNLPNNPGASETALAHLPSALECEIARLVTDEAAYREDEADENDADEPITAEAWAHALRVQA